MFLQDGEKKFEKHWKGDLSDGKPLYRKVFSYNSLGLTANNTWKVLEDVSSLNIDTTASISYVVNRGNYGFSNAGYRSTTETGLEIKCTNSNDPESKNKLIVICYSGYDKYNYKTYITLEYTKTTD